MNETKDFDKRPVSLDEVERENVASEYLTEGMLDEHFISAPRINSAAVEKLLGNPAKILVSTDGKWVVSGTGDGIAVMSSSKLGQAVTIDGVEFKTGDTSMRAAVVAAFAKGVEAAVKSDMAKPMKVAATSGFTFNPYAMKNVKAYTKSMPLRGSVTVTDLIAMAAGGMLKDSRGGSNVVQSLYTVLTRGESAFKVSASDATLVGYAASFKMDESKFTAKKAGKVSTTAPEGLTMGGKVPRVGDWVTGSLHYSMLSGADAYQIVGFEGKSTVVAQEFKMKDVSKDGHTRVLALSSEKIGQPVKLRVGKSGGIKNGSINLHLVTKNDAEVNGIRYTGSMYD